MKEYKSKTIKLIHDFIDITVVECCKNCKECKEKPDCPLTNISDGFSNIFGVKILKDV